MGQLPIWPQRELINCDLPQFVRPATAIYFSKSDNIFYMCSNKKLTSGIMGFGKDSNLMTEAHSPILGLI